jgi:hypothetical protein
MGEHRPGVESSHQHRSCPPRQTGRLQAKRSRRIPSSDRHAFILLTPTFAGVGHALAQMGTTRAAIFSVRIRADASPRGTAIEGVGREGCGERRSPSQGVAAAAGRGRPRNGALLEPALPSPWPVRSRAAWQMLLCRVRLHRADRAVENECRELGAHSGRQRPCHPSPAPSAARARQRTAKDGQRRRSHGCRMPGRGYA